MLKKTGKRKWIMISAVVLALLNMLAFYVIQNSLGLAEAIRNTKNKSALESLQQKEIFSDVFSSFIFTLDIFGLLFVIYLLIKGLISILKNSTSTKK
ncbi:MAG: hypothetical protein ACOH1X_11530 [Kaistella sp.]